MNPSKINWTNVIFFGVTHILGLIAAPLYIYFNGISWGEIALFLFYFSITGIGITVGYHRLFTHRAYKVGKWVTFLNLFFGAAAFEQSAIDWASHHRDHHRYVDTDKDPYSIKKGFFFAHMGWMIFWNTPPTYPNVKDLQNDPMIQHQHTHYLAWAIVSGIFLPFLIGVAMGHGLGALLISVCARIALVYQGTWCINSVAHTFGQKPYDLAVSAKDNWFAALFTWGEGYHNFHHRFPNDYRNGIRWYQWDPSKWLIALLKAVDLASDLKRTSKFKILNAKISAQNNQAILTLNNFTHWSEHLHIHESISSKYAQVISLLQKWEQQYATQKPLKFARARTKLIKKQFRKAYREWAKLQDCFVYLPKVAPLLS